MKPKTTLKTHSGIGIKCLECNRAGKNARIVGAMILLLVICLPTGCSKNQKDTSVAMPAVRVAPVRRVDDFKYVQVSGSVVSPCAPSMISFLVSGRVTQVLPREGDYVKAGQLLAVIDSADYRLSVQSATAQTVQARVALQRAESEYARMKFLFDSKSLAPNDFEKFRAAYDAARQQLDQANANEQLMRKHLIDTELRAPVSGFVAMRGIEPGDLAAPGRPVFSIVGIDPVEIHVGVPETDVRLLRKGSKVTITVPALPGRTFRGTVGLVNVAADPTSRTYMTRIIVANPDRVLRIGMIAEAGIQSPERTKVMTLPGDAVVRDPQGAKMVYVYYPDKKRVHARQIETGALYDRDVQIKRGLSGTELVVIAGQDKLREGETVALADSLSPSSPVAATNAGGE